MPNDPRCILLVQDDPVDAASVRESLMSPGETSLRVEWVRRCSEALERLAGDAQQQTDVAAVLVDLFLPDSQGIDTFERLFKAAPHVPILVLSAARDEAVAKQAVQRGAQDYLLKDRLDNYLLPKALGSMIDRAAIAETLFEEKERAQVTLNSIGDAVMSCDAAGRLTYLNTVAEQLTGWTCESAAGRRVDEVFRVVDSLTRAPLPDPMALAIRGNKTVLLSPNSILCRRDGVEAAIEDSAAPIHDRRGHVTGAVMVFHDVSTTRALSLRVSHQARHDSLTDLPNRTLLNDRLAHAIALAKRHGCKLAVMFLDLDRFKSINDSLGHDTGDKILRLVAQRLLGCVRSSDTVCRHGGDEFIILLSELMHGDDAAVSAEKILLALSKPYDIATHDLHVTASIGIAIHPEDGEGADQLIQRADFAMYHAKNRGRSNFIFFREDMNVRARERQSIEDGLRLALERDEFVLQYQLIVNLRNGAPTGIEALIRWRHPHHGLLLPARFLPIAADSGCIVPIGRWALREACRQNRAWQDAGLPPIRVAVNVSAVESRDKGFVAGVRNALAESGLAPHLLECELTETFLLHDSSSTAEVLRSLKESGVQIALDDFGTGYSSLSHLKDFPIDALKIDETFVSGLGTNRNDGSIVRAVVNLGNSLRKRVVAEGVETASQLAFLQAQRCGEGQGFYFGRPMAAGEVAERLSQCLPIDAHAPRRRANTRASPSGA
jgi:diguanylate cyclase (GGDEF)-like protein/PAS domain S-box-containing protein